MNKKTFHKRIVEEDEYDDDSEDQNSRNLLKNIHNKIDKSAALNGGFDRLLFKIDGIEKSQIQIVEKVDKIHEAIYNPDDGLFSRIAANKAGQIEAVTKIEKQLIEFSSWKQQYEDDGESCEKEADEIQDKIIKIEKTLDDLEKFRSLAAAAGKWVAAAVAGAVFSYIAEIVYKLGK